MMEVLQMISYIVWIMVGITMIGGMLWSFNFQTKMTKTFMGDVNSKKDKEA
jgi:hypothetical protein